MNFDRSLIFAYLEEDNIQRAYFRVRPLLTLNGDVREEAVALWPNEGGLRIVPDRNEQHTFKVRMRSLGAYCVVDLRNQPPEAGKIRTNKNFRPDKGEVNQYILYSDTVHELPENTFYQILDGAAEDYAALAESSITPLFYIRQDDTLYGPVRKAAPTAPGTAKEAAGVLYEIPCPDGVTRMLFCIDETPDVQAEAQNEKAAEPASDELPAVVPETTPVQAPAPQTAEEPRREEAGALPLGETLQILDQNTTHEETLKKLDKPVSSDANLLKQTDKPAVPSPVPVRNVPLSGTPLIRTPLHMSVQQTKNRTQEVVSSQWSVGKYEPPAQNLPTGTAMRTVENPVEAACSHLRAAWNSIGARGQLADFILSLDGAQAQLEAKLCKGGNSTIMQRVLRERLEDLEAERLTALCELDKAHRDLDAYKRDLVNGLSARIARETHQLEQDRAAAESFVTSLKKEINALTHQRDALLDKIHELHSETLPEAIAKLVTQAQMTAPVNGVPLRMSPVSGEKTNPDTLIDRLMGACAASGIAMTRNHAIALLVLLAVCPRIGLACATPAAAFTLIRNIACAFGWKDSCAQQYSQDQRPMVGIRPVDATPALLTTSLPNYASINGVTKLLLNRSAVNLIRNAAYDVNQWPVLLLPPLPFVPEIDAADAVPVSAASITEFLNASAATQAELETVFAPIIKAAVPLSGAARKEMFRFAAVCAGLMEGGLPAAADWAILLWIVPALERGSKAYAAVKPLLDEYPLSLSKLS